MARVFMAYAAIERVLRAPEANSLPFVRASRPRRPPGRDGFSFLGLANQTTDTASWDPGAAAGYRSSAFTKPLIVSRTKSSWDTYLNSHARMPMSQNHIERRHRLSSPRHSESRSS